MTRVVLAAALVGTSALLLAQAERLDGETLARIRDEGLSRSQVMSHVSWLSDVYGPRLTGSLGLERASEWAMKTLTSWGLTNPHQERFPFGKGWTLERFDAHLIEPSVQPIIGFPQEWSSSTKGRIVADVVRPQIATDADFDRYRGRLAGTIVLTQPERAVRMLEGPFVLRMTPKDLLEANTVPAPTSSAAPAASVSNTIRDAIAFRQKVLAFYLAEGVVALFDRGPDTDMVAGGSDLSWQQQRPDGGTIFPTGSGSRGANAGTGLPFVTLAVEHYNRMVRILDKGVKVRVELNVQTKFVDETTPNGLNTFADIPGTDLASQQVLIGAHLDSHPYATGATDNAAGVAAMMEAARILKAVGVEPRRTIRVALWGGEEQGLLGSRAYVRDHLGDVRTMTLLPEHANVSAYFNSDNGTGRVRGVWLQGNTAVRPIFEQWIAPLASLGVTQLSPRSVTQTDHVSFDDVGIPAFQFLVDRLEYNSRTHHSNMDTVDRIQPEELEQQATVVAIFAYNAAMRDERLPRKPLPAARR